jgi:ArsR family transcriptional regulator
LTIFLKTALTKIAPGINIRIMSKYRDKDIEEFAEIFKALSNPNRLRIFLRLVSCCAPGTRASMDSNMGFEQCACVGELGQDLGIVASTISHHIKELRRAGLIRVERRGQKIECWIDPKTIEALQGFFS